MCMPNASDMASAIAIVRIPLIMTAREWVPEWSPTISPNVVITPDVRPKLRPVLNDVFINLHCRCGPAPLQAGKSQHRIKIYCNLARGDCVKAAGRMLKMVVLFVRGLSCSSD